MANVVNLRVSPQIPFPAIVVGSMPIKLSKANGVWTVAFDVADLVTRVPSVSDIGSEYVAVWDSINQTFVKVALASFAALYARTQRSVIVSPIVVGGTDQIINFNINAGSPTCTLDLASTRRGVPVTFKDAGGHAAAHPLTISFTGGEKCDGESSVTIEQNFGEITLNPFNDGVNTGWYL